MEVLTPLLWSLSENEFLWGLSGVTIIKYNMRIILHSSLMEISLIVKKKGATNSSRHSLTVV
jgi:hypothetical protein